MKKYIFGAALCIAAVLYQWFSLDATKTDAKTTVEQLPSYEQCPYNDSLEGTIICCMQHYPNEVKKCVRWVFDGIVTDDELDTHIVKIQNMLTEIKKDPKILNTIKKSIDLKNKK